MRCKAPYWVETLENALDGLEGRYQEARADGAKGDLFDAARKKLSAPEVAEIERFLPVEFGMASREQNQHWRRVTRDLGHCANFLFNYDHGLILSRGEPEAARNAAYALGGLDESETVAPSSAQAQDTFARVATLLANPKVPSGMREFLTSFEQNITSRGLHVDSAFFNLVNELSNSYP